MPSWNIHVAHVERLLAECAPEALGIADANVFLFGNLVPDIYVGYVVSPITRKIEYAQTHIAEPAFIPTPDAGAFFERYVRGRGRNDLALGAWAHLICDHYYNLRTREYIARIGVMPGKQTRIRKQADFDLFGRSLGISSVVECTEGLVAACADFEQYGIDAADVRETVRVERDIVRANQRERASEPIAYSLLTSDFFSSVFDEVSGLLGQALLLHAGGQDASFIGRS